jgi:hypothetical protein
MVLGSLNLPTRGVVHNCNLWRGWSRNREPATARQQGARPVNWTSQELQDGIRLSISLDVLNNRRACKSAIVGERTVMKIVRIAATPLNVPLQISLPGIERKTSLEACFVEIETDAGISGHGLAAITRETVIAEIVNGVIAPAIKGDDPMANERIWDKLY